MLRVARCESDLAPTAVNRSGGSYGLFQFKPRTWLGTPFAEYDIFDPRASANAAAWMWSQGRRREWVCQWTGVMGECSRRLLRQVATVDRQDDASDERSVGGGEEQDGGRDLARFTDPTHRMHLLDRRQILDATRLLRQAHHALGADRPRCDGVDADAAVGPLDRQMLGDAGGDEFGWSVGRLPLLPRDPRDRGETDDRPSSGRQHRLDRVLARQPHTAAVDGHHLVPVLDGRFQNIAEGDDPRVRHQHVELAVAIDGGLNHP